jgi:pilus assembly protein CpaE
MAATQQAGDRTLRVLIVGADPTLEAEFRSATANVPDTHFVVQYVDSHRQALEAARGRQPNFVLVGLDGDVAEVAALSKDLHGVAPDVAVAAAFKRDQLDQGESGSTTIIELLRAQVEDFIRRPLSATEVRAVLDRLFTRIAATDAPEQGRVLTFLSNKGGVGKSTLAVNVAVALALRHPDQVLLVDASLQGGTCAAMLDVKPTTSVVDAVRQKDRLDATLLRHLTLRHESGLRVLAAPADALEGAEVDDEAVARILNLASRGFQYVVVDTFPMIDNVVMTVLDLTDAAYIVMQGLAPSVAGVARLLPVLEGLGFSQARQRLVLNYNYQPFVGNLKPGDIADRLQRTVDYVVPYEKGVLTSMNTGSPHVLHGSWWQRFGKVMEQIVNDVDAVQPGASSGGADDGARARLGERRRGATSNA